MTVSTSLSLDLVLCARSIELTLLDAFSSDDTESAARVLASLAKFAPMFRIILLRAHYVSHKEYYVLFLLEY